MFEKYLTRFLICEKVGGLTNFGGEYGEWIILTHLLQTLGWHNRNRIFNLCKLNRWFGVSFIVSSSSSLALANEKITAIASSIEIFLNIIVETGFLRWETSEMNKNLMSLILQFQRSFLYWPLSMKSGHCGAREHLRASCPRWTFMLHYLKISDNVT